jgi:photosystem II stability/assembly factor-like uncharacterized protein
MKLRLRLMITLLLLAFLLAACATPATKSPDSVKIATQPELQATNTLPPAATESGTAPAAPTDTSAPPETSTPQIEPTAEPQPTATLPVIEIQMNRLAAKTLITFNQIKMTSATAGWGIGRGPGSNQDHVFRTSDGGLHWTDITPPQKMPSSATEVVQASASFLGEQVWVIFSGEAPMPITGPVVVWRSNDSGLSWEYSTPLQVDDAPYFITDPPAFADEQHGWLLGHVDAGMSHDYVMLFSTQDGGQSWTRIADPYSQNIPQICCKTGLVFADTQIGWLSGDTNGVSPEVFLYQTQDAGQSWTLINLPAPGDTPDAFTDTNLYCGTYDPRLFSARQGKVIVRCHGSYSANHAAWLYSTQDGGQTWQTLRLPGLEGSLQMVTPDLGFYLTTSGFFRTQDSGRTWTLQSKPTWTGWLSFVDEKTGWVAAKAADGGTALVTSSSAGTKWIKLDPVVIP